MSRLPFLLLLSLPVTFAIAQAAPLQLSSPGGKLYVNLFMDAQDHLAYSVSEGDRTRLEAARVGVIIDDVDLGAKVRLGTPEVREISEEFPWRGNKSTAGNRCRAYTIGVRAAAGVDWTLEVRVFDDGAAFRHLVPGSGRRRVSGESTHWRLPEDSTVWFQTNTRDYEGVFQSSNAARIPLEESVDEVTRPTLLGPPVTVAFADGSFGVLTEASLYNYSGLVYRPIGDSRLAAAFPGDPAGWLHEGPVVSPWRVLVLGKDLDALVNNDVIAALGEPPDVRLFPDGLETSWIRPGKAPCTWMVFGNEGAQWERQKWFVDLSAAMGCEYLLVDAGWQTEKWGWLADGGDLWSRAAELCRYAADRGVGIFLWHAFAEGRDDGPGLTDVARREAFFRNCREAGVRGVKIDFFNSESKAIIEAYEDLLRRSAEHELMIVFHGANKPTGEMRTWPHQVSREGIRAQEYVLWDSLPLTHYGALPFTRLIAGAADFQPGFVQPRFLKNTTLAFQMATSVVFSSPFHCWADNPEAYVESPLLELVRSLPATWDETRVLPGSVIGDTVVMARRSGQRWHVAVLNCRPEARTLDLDVSSLAVPGGVMTFYRDGASASEFQIESGLQVPGDGKVSIVMRPGGGFVARIGPGKEYDGWR